MCRSRLGGHAPRDTSQESLTAEASRPTSLPGDLSRFCFYKIYGRWGAGKEGKDIFNTSSWIGKGFMRQPPLRSYWQLVIDAAKGVIFFSGVVW